VLVVARLEDVCPIARNTFLLLIISVMAEKTWSDEMNVYTYMQVSIWEE